MLKVLRVNQNYFTTMDTIVVIINNPYRRLASNFSSQYHPRIKQGCENKGIDHQWRRLLTVKQIPLLSIIGNVQRTVWRIWKLLLGYQGLINSWMELGKVMTHSFELSLDSNISHQLFSFTLHPLFPTILKSISKISQLNDVRKFWVNISLILKKGELRIGVYGIWQKCNHLCLQSYHDQAQTCFRSKEARTLYFSVHRKFTRDAGWQHNTRCV